MSAIHFIVWEIYLITSLVSSSTLPFDKSFKAYYDEIVMDNSSPEMQQGNESSTEATKNWLKKSLENIGGAMGATAKLLLKVLPIGVVAYILTGHNLSFDFSFAAQGGDVLGALKDEIEKSVGQNMSAGADFVNNGLKDASNAIKERL